METILDDILGGDRNLCSGQVKKTIKELSNH